MTDSYQKRSDRIFYYIDLAGYKMCKPRKHVVYIILDQILTLLYKLGPVLISAKSHVSYIVFARSVFTMRCKQMYSLSKLVHDSLRIDL